MKDQVPLDPAARADTPPQADDPTPEFAPELAYRRLMMVNVVFAGRSGAGDRQWTLIDAGVPGTTGLIEHAARERFGGDSRPAAIIMTHGHFDHIGGLEKLARRWDAPIYAHELELPYLNGSAAYPPPDALAGGGLMPLLSPLFPRGPIDVSRWLHALPPDGSVPSMPGWRWIHTPGHTPGHVSFWREADRALIAGDAFITTGQESAYSVAVQKPEMHGPPMYFTPDWVSARESVRKLAALEPEVVVTGHGRPMQGEAMRTALHTLARDFDEVAVPKHGRYTGRPATAEDGTAYREP
ncbi:MAG: MBL fold metallo-hydrolase [Verrucomicrobia bacterium]|nr:MBL fold metallo-hydrolase [Verrucomicrobiota bacterium]